jgi:tetratricopeptide (TPR) repeat protein
MLRRTTIVLLIIFFIVSAFGLVYRVVVEQDEEQVIKSDVVTDDGKITPSNESSPWQALSPDKDIKDADLPAIPYYDKEVQGSEDQTSRKKLASSHLKSGYSKIKSGEYRGAISDLEESIKLDEYNSDTYIGLGLAYYKVKEIDRAADNIEKGLRISSSALGYKIMGEIYYQRDDIDKALGYWEKSLGLEPGDQELRRKFLKASKELETHKGFNREATRHFIVQYEGGENSEIGRKIVDILEDAYSQIGGELSYYPGRELTVILYSNQQFKYVTDGPSWSSGIYDGKIRIPIGGLKGDEPMLRNILFHEYTHSLVRSLTDKCPAWLNEGLAQYFERKDKERAKMVMKELLKRKSNAPLELLEGSFLGLNKNQAELVYTESLSAVNYMIERYGTYRVKEILLELSRGNSIDESFRSAIHISYKEFESDWLKSMEG